MNEAEVKVDVDLRTQYDSIDTETEIVGVLGSCEEFGCWNPQGAAIAQPSARNHWDVKVSLPARCHVYWKWVVLDKASRTVTRWEERDNRVLTLCGSGVFIYAIWNGVQRVHMPIRPMRQPRNSNTPSFDTSMAKYSAAAIGPRDIQTPDSFSSFPYTMLSRVEDSDISPQKCYSHEELAFPPSPKKVSFPEKMVTSVAEYSDHEEEVEHFIEDLHKDSFVPQSILKKSKCHSPKSTGSGDEDAVSSEEKEPALVDYFNDGNPAVLGSDSACSSNVDMEPGQTSEASLSCSTADDRCTNPSATEPHHVPTPASVDASSSSSSSCSSEDSLTGPQDSESQLAQENRTMKVSRAFSRKFSRGTDVDTGKPELLAGLGGDWSLEKLVPISLINFAPSVAVGAAAAIVILNRVF